MIADKPVTAARQPASILVVDDMPANLQVLSGMLKERGYKVRPVPSGKLALLAARRAPPELILLDINMPEMNGYEVCQQLKADDNLKGIPVIFLSAHTEQVDKVKAFSLGGVDYLTKPFQMEELHARVETHLKLRRLTELEEANTRLAEANSRLSHDLALLSVARVGGMNLVCICRSCDELAHLPADADPVVLERAGPPIGLADAGYEEQSVRLGAGDRLYLYSNGVSEARDPSGEQFGTARLLEAIRQRRSTSLKEGMATLVGEISQWRGAERAKDDISILALEVSVEPGMGEPSNSRAGR